ncbi:MAG: hypothetical protein LBD48_13525 [Treponema sp.]|jgi:hypothetical protein|nr:hypothetical protein [Treponema sp.]
MCAVKRTNTSPRISAGNQRCPAGVWFLPVAGVFYNYPPEIEKKSMKMVKSCDIDYIEAVAKLQFCNSNLLKMHVS